MKRSILMSLLFIGLTSQIASAQYHSLEMPQASPKVVETQRLGLTDITVDYHSPAVRGREIWGNVVPMNGEPIPWRAGANMNTKIAFSTDVLIEGQLLEAGSYGFHAIPTENEWTLIFANNDNLWGSYYLDLNQHVALKVQVTPDANDHTEQLDYAFINRTDSTVQVAIQWADKSIPFTVGVDLNKTVVESFRYNLGGPTTYAWEAWDAAARWCLNHNTNLEEALTWAQRSIDGGYNGYSAKKEFQNLMTLSELQWKLGKTTEADASAAEAITLMSDPMTTFWSGRALIDNQRYDQAITLYQAMDKKFPDTWFVQLGFTRAYYASGNSKMALKSLDKTMKSAPENYKDYLAGMKTKIENGETI